MQKRFFAFVLVVIFSSTANSQVKTYPKNYFRNPLDVPMKLAANFGEIRFNHWHMGLDIRTEQRENLPVYAAADGYIAEVRVEPGGFGQAVFINHPNGLTTVYGHLNHFAPDLQQYITGQQYNMESWQVDLSIAPNLFPVRKGQLIAYSGNTGGSQGPHLHFEIRDTKTTRCLNPLLFGMPIEDNVPPAIVRLALYDRGRSVYDQSPKLFPVRKAGSIFNIPGLPVLKTGYKKVSFAIQAYDKLSGAHNPIGIYEAALFEDEKPVINFYIDSIDYVETHGINAQVDYKYSYNGGVNLQHLSQLPGDRSRVYNHINGKGGWELNDMNVHNISIEVRDPYMIMSLLQFKTQYDERLATAPAPSFTQRFSPNLVNTLQKDDFELYLPANILYDTIQPDYSAAAINMSDAVSASHRFCDASIPPADYFSVRIKPARAIPSAWNDKLVIKNEYGSRSSVRKAEWQNGWLTARFDDFGTFQAFADQEPPAINAPGRGDTMDLSAASRIVFFPSDNFGIRAFRAELDGKWLMFTNDKGRAFIYNFDERCPYGVHSLKVSVTDIAGNTTIKNWWFKKYPYTGPKKKAGKHRAAHGKKGGHGKKKVAKKKRK